MYRPHEGRRLQQSLRAWSLRPASPSPIQTVPCKLEVKKDVQEHILRDPSQRSIISMLLLMIFLLTSAVIVFKETLWIQGSEPLLNTIGLCVCVKSYRDRRFRISSVSNVLSFSVRSCRDRGFRISSFTNVVYFSVRSYRDRRFIISSVTNVLSFSVRSYRNRGFRTSSNILSISVRYYGDPQLV